MLDAKRRMILAGLLAMLALLPVGYSDCGSTATASPASEEAGSWVWKNLRQDWNYLFHPERVNQCKPREITGYRKALGPGA